MRYVFEIILTVLIYKAANIADNSASNRTVVVLIHPGILNRPTGGPACMLIGILCHIFIGECNSERGKFHSGDSTSQATIALQFEIRQLSVQSREAIKIKKKLLQVFGEQRPR